MCYQVTDKGFVEAVVKLPLLKDLDLSDCKLSHESLKVVGQSCPNLKSVMLNYDCYGTGWRYWGYGNAPDKEALAIAETMPRLRHLQLIGNKLTNTGLNAILDKCPNLEYLDLRKCSHVNLVGELEKRCFERVRVVRGPNDSRNGYPFDANIRARGDYEDDQSSGCSDEDTDRPRYCDDYLSDYDEYCVYDQYDELYDFFVD